MPFDPTPDGVKLFRANAIGFGVSILAVFGAMWWWIIKSAPMAAGEPFLVGFFGAIAAATALFYFLPAAIPRRTWGYVVGWIQIVLAMTSGTATLPTIAVLIAWVRDETREWFDRRPIDARANNPATLRAKMIAIIGYYAVISVIPFGVVAALPAAGGDTLEMTQAITTRDVQVTKQHDRVAEYPLDGPEEVHATHLISRLDWDLQEQDGPIAVTVWASYCGACEYQLSAIAKDGTPGHKTQHVTMALDCDKKPHKVRRKLAKSNIESPALCLVDGLEVDVLPTTIFYDANGQRRATLSGYQPTKALDDVALAVESLP